MFTNSILFLYKLNYTIDLFLSVFNFVNIEIRHRTHWHTIFEFITKFITSKRNNVAAQILQA